MRKILGLVVFAATLFLSTADIAAAQSPSGPAVGIGQVLNTLTSLAGAVTDPSGQPVQVDQSLLPPWVGKAIVIAFSIQGLLLLLSSALMKLGAATKNSTETNLGTMLGKLSWSLGAVLSHFGGQKPPAPTPPPGPTV